MNAKIRPNKVVGVGELADGGVQRMGLCYLIPVIWRYPITCRMTHILSKQVFWLIWIQTFVLYTQDFTKIVMKGDKKRRQFGFKHGNKLNLLRGNTPKLELNVNESVHYIRPTAEEEDLMRDPPINPECYGQTAESENQAGRMVFLRSKSQKTSTSNSAASNPM